MSKNHFCFLLIPRQNSIKKMPCTQIQTLKLVNRLPRMHMKGRGHTYIFLKTSFMNYSLRTRNIIYHYTCWIYLDSCPYLVDFIMHNYQVKENDIRLAGWTLSWSQKYPNQYTSHYWGTKKNKKNITYHNSTKIWI